MGGVVLLASVARADAPSNQYELFNENNVFIQDHFTGLMWERYPQGWPAGILLTFTDAVAHCNQLSLDGYTGWRLPSYKELMTLVDEAPHVEYEDGILVTKWIDGNAFPQAAVGTPYWTSSVFPASGGASGFDNIYALSFFTGVPAEQDTTLPSSTLLARCVR